MKKFNPQRKLYQGHYWKVNFDWIKQEICKLYNGVNDNDINRELMITKVKNSYKNTGSYIFSLVGSPPKGHAIYLPNYNKLIFISMSGEKIKKREDIIIEELE